MPMCNSGESTEDLKETWIQEQIELRKKLITENEIDWDLKSLELIGGVDISFKKGDDEHACPGLVVMSYPDLKIVYQDFSLEHLKVPYISNFLAFREVPLLKDKIDRLRTKAPQHMPQVIMVDGNGIHHGKGFGIACHLGVLTDLPSIGVAKNLLNINGITKEAHSEQIKKELLQRGDRFPLQGTNRDTTAMAIRSSEPCRSQSCKPIYVSVGHRIGLAIAVELVLACCNNRIPEPIRQIALGGGQPLEAEKHCVADILSRKYLRENYEKDLGKCSCRNANNS